ncbi:hypothetical protein [Bacillus norwichensis]|uniref:Uncharacterized protein n=1 Tax=Bacillus norwichensis TaxID=2762217 RepID=A0ABR8VPW5_9BACI|nr:hypothetical protein [Bacillus norwichensis]MBD8006800.1 hypothetical protein [Bacillus norwichensis]
MHCLCGEQTSELKVEGDIGADPIWCSQCGANCDLEEIPVSKELKRELREWASMYGEWTNWDLDKLIPNGVEMENEHNIQGAKLTEKVHGVLKGRYEIVFVPSIMARSYCL